MLAGLYAVRAATVCPLDQCDSRICVLLSPAFDELVAEMMKPYIKRSFDGNGFNLMNPALSPTDPASYLLHADEVHVRDPIQQTLWGHAQPGRGHAQPGASLVHYQSLPL